MLKNRRLGFSCFVSVRYLLEMATVAEKVQGVSGEGHQKVKNDHEQFLEAYESKWNKEWLMREKKKSFPIGCALFSAFEYCIVNAKCDVRHLDLMLDIYMKYLTI